MANNSKKTKIFVAVRAKFCCEYCISQEAYSPDYFSIEHTFPKSLTKSNDLESLAFSCQSCNNHKYIATTAIDPLTLSVSSLYNPRNHEWDEHFIWTNNFSIIEGITPIGRCTVVKLKINRVSVVNLREVLTIVGKHQPY
jgi:hypothetical protein